MQEIVAKGFGTKEEIEKILADYPETRDSDKLLWLAYMCIYHDLKKKIGVRAYNILKETMFLPEVAAYPTLVRMRQVIQHNERKHRTEHTSERASLEEDVRYLFGSTQ